MRQVSNGLLRTCLFLILFTVASSFMLNAISAFPTNDITLSKNTVAVKAIPVPARKIAQNMFSKGPSGVPQVNPYSGTSIPAPVGIADYGIGPSGTYQYSTSSFVGIAAVNSLVTRTSSNSPSMTMQLNVNFVYTSNGEQYVYWIQNVAWIDTSSNQIDKIDFSGWIFNFSAANVPIMQSGIAGSGYIYNGVYSDSPSPLLSGNYVDLQYPASIFLNVTCWLNADGKPTISFGYDDGYGLVTYDTVEFLTSYPVTSFGFVVNGNILNPYGSFYNSELILGGPGGGSNTTLIQSDMQLQLEFWNGHNYQMITNAYNFGHDTGETIINALSQTYYYPSTGSIIIEILPGTETLSKLYDQSTVGIIDVKSSIASGNLAVTNASDPYATPWQTPFSNGEVTITIVPFSYNLKLYQNAVLYGQVNCTVSPGQTLSLQTLSITLLPAGASTPVSGNNHFVVTYYLNDQPQVAYAQNGTLKLIADSGINVNLAGVSSGSSSTEQWVLNSQGSFAYVPAGSTATLYYYDLLSQQVAYFAGTNSISPTLTYSTAPLTSSSEFNPTVTVMYLPYFWQQTIMVLRGTTVSVSNNILGTEHDQWAVPVSSWIISQVNQIYTDVSYYHQYQFIASYSTSDGSVPLSNPMLSGTQFGSNYQLPLTTTNQTTWLDENTPWSTSTIATAPSGTEQWILTTGASGNVTVAITINPSYIHQYYLTVASTYGSPTGQGWYNSGSTAYAGLNSGTLSGGTGTQYVFASWSTGGTNYAQSDAITMDSPVTATAYWSTQYYLTVSSAYGSPLGSGWYDSGDTAYASVSSNIVPGGTGTRYVFGGWTGDASGSGATSNGIIMNTPKTATATWKTQYQLTFTVTPSGTGSTTPTGSSLWVDSGPLSISVAPNSGYSFSQWTANSAAITFSDYSSMSTTANVNGPGTITASLTVKNVIVNPTPSPSQTPNPSSTSTPTPTPTVPEFPSVAIIAIVLLIATAAILFYKRKITFTIRYHVATVASPLWSPPC